MLKDEEFETLFFIKMCKKITFSSKCFNNYVFVFINSIYMGQFEKTECKGEVKITSNIARS